MEIKTRLLKVFSEVQPKSVEWLCYPYIPLGKITLTLYEKQGVVDFDLNKVEKIFDSEFVDTEAM